MKSVLISIQPKWCELIANGKKTVEIRKTKPKIDTPFKVYIYCTQGDALAYPCINNPQFSIHRMIDSRSLHGRRMTPKEREESDYTFANGKVIGEFVCDNIYTFKYEAGGFLVNGDIATTQNAQAMSCLSDSEFRKYAKEKSLYGWHISDLIIYDKPKELSEFYTECQMNCEHCEMWGYTRVNANEFDMDCKSDWFEHKPFTRPPQSWCYVEDMSEKGR